jgi:hypothetical protein
MVQAVSPQVESGVLVAVEREAAGGAVERSLLEALEALDAFVPHSTRGAELGRGV